MAETWTENGLQYMTNTAFRTGHGTGSQAALTTFYAGLFVSQTSSTVPASTASGASVGWTEAVAATGTYTRQAIVSASVTQFASVGASSWGGSFPVVLFTGFTTAAASPINGWVLLSGSVASTASPLMFANFDSGASYAMSTSSASLSLTPSIAGLS